MGDRTNCALTIYGDVDQSTFDKIVAAVETAGSDGDQSCYQAGNFFFEEVNYAEMDESLRKLLREERVVFTWISGAGDSYGEGIIIEDPANNRSWWFRTVESEIALTVQQWQSEERTDAEAAQQFLDSAKPFKLVKPGFTVWVMEASGNGTHHVSHHQTHDIEEAKRLAIEETMADWNEPGGDRFSEEDLTVLGVLHGRPEIAEWNEPC